MQLLHHEKGEPADLSLLRCDLEPTCLRITQFPTLPIVIEVGTAALDALAGRIDIEHTAMGKMAGFWNVTAWSESEPHRPMAEDAL
jgi:hypothetical protein